jgi:hypothetical protein
VGYLKAVFLDSPLETEKIPINLNQFSDNSSEIKTHISMNAHLEIC